MNASYQATLFEFEVAPEQDSLARVFAAARTPCTE
jgi:hypothetical protein